MFFKATIGCLLVGLILVPLPGYAQKTKEQTSESARPTDDDSTAAPRSTKLSRVVRGIIRATNQFRRQKDRQELRVNAKLSRAAQYFANYMARTGKFSHTADGKEPSERVTSFGYDYCLVLENIAYRYNSAGYTSRKLVKDFMKSWKKSPGHRKNMLDPDITEVGVGVARSKDGKYYAVQDFGRPESEAIRFRIANRTKATITYSVDGKTNSIEPGYTVTHQRCRPPKVTFQWPKEEESTTAPESKVYRPRNDTLYVIRKDRSDSYRVKKK